MLRIFTRYHNKMRAINKRDNKKSYIQTRPKRLMDYEFWKINAQGSKKGYKMGDYCYKILERFPLNIC